MESFVEPIRYSTSLMALATAALAFRLLARGERSRMLAAAGAWLILATGLGLVVTHGVRTLPSPVLVPALAALGVALGIAALLTSDLPARLTALTDRDWRLLMSTRAAFGALILAAGVTGLFPAAFALPAGIGDIVVAALALVVPGSLAAGGSRAARLVVFGVGLVDFANVLRLMAVVLVPWLVETHSLGISLLLPWVVVPLLVTLNIAGLRQLLAERTRAPATT